MDKQLFKQILRDNQREVVSQPPDMHARGNCKK